MVSLMPGFLKRLIEAPDLSRLRRRAVADASPRSALDLCRRLQMQGRREEAMEAAREALARFPHSCELADILRSTWKIQCRDAIEELFELIQESPSVRHYCRLIDHFMEYGEVREAARWADRMVLEFPHDRNGILVQGKVYDRCFRTDHVALDGAKAIRNYRRALEIHPSAFEPHLLLAQICAYIGAVSKALHHAFKAQDVDPDNAEASALQQRLSWLPLEEQSESDLLRYVEENDGPPLWRGREQQDGEALQSSQSAALSQAVQQLSAMTGLRRVVLLHDGINIQGIDGRLVAADDPNNAVMEILARFRRTAAISGKRMGIGGFQEAELFGAEAHCLAFAAGPTVLLLETDPAPRMLSAVAEARNLIAACTQVELVPVGGHA